MRRLLLTLAIPVLYLTLGSNSCERGCDEPTPTVCFGPDGPANGRYVGFIIRKGAANLTSGGYTTDSIAVRLTFSDGQYTVEPLGTSPAFEVPDHTGTFSRGGQDPAVPDLFNFRIDQGALSDYDMNLLLTHEWTIRRDAPNQLSMFMYAPTAFFARVYEYRLHPEPL